MSRLIISARYWNDIEWVRASLQHIEYWQADEVYLSEGNWDPAWNARSNDGTREILEKFASSRENVSVIDNVRKDKNYRVNQADTSNLAMKLAGAKPGDWMLIIDADHFYLKKDITYIKELIRKEGNSFDYITHYTYNFLYTLKEYNIYYDKVGTKLPYRLLKGCMWKSTNHLCIGDKLYHNVPRLRGYFAKVTAMHYEGLHSSKRLKDRYAIGDRKTFEEYKDGIRLKDLKYYEGSHPEFVIPTLKNKGHLIK